MKNEIVIDLNELCKQQNAIMNSNIDEINKEGLLNLISTIQDLAEDYSQEKEVTFVIVVK